MSHGITHHDQMFSVRAMPWHGLGVVLDQYPRSINEALDKAGLGWKVTHGDILVVRTPEWTDDSGPRCARPSTARTRSVRFASATRATSRPNSPRPDRCWA